MSESNKRGDKMITKKTIALALLLMTGSVSVFAGSPEEEKEARYAELKKYKAERRAERDQMKQNPEGPADKEPGFWEREAERSGLGGSQNRIGSFFKNLNPVPFFKEQQEKYESRKAHSEAGHASEQAQWNAAPQSAVAATK
jgi:hypothetical protein